MKKILSTLMFSIIFFSVNICSAMTDDVGVLGGLETNNGLYEYLNSYNYRLWKADHRFLHHDMYINQDDSVIVSVFNDILDSIFILNPGYKTNKGIEVGMTENDLIYAYGPIYGESDRSFDLWKNSGGQVVKNYDENYSKYYSVEYISSANEGLEFIFDRHTRRIVLIRYQHNRHGNTRALDDVKSYTLLPKGHY